MTREVWDIEVLDGKGVNAFLRPLLGILLASGMVLVALAGFAPYQVHVVDVMPMILPAIPPRFDVMVTLNNGGVFDVRVEGILRLEWRTAGEGMGFKEYRFKSAAIPSRGVGRADAAVDLNQLYSELQLGTGDEPELRMWADIWYTIILTINGPITSRTITERGETRIPIP